MQFYLVGGAVRDERLGRDVVDRDFVVVGGSGDQLIAAGFSVRDADFGVYLHPDTDEEYTLARRERHTGEGHRGFSIDCSPDITLEEDLARRDLTINAIGQAADGTFVDPFDGLADLEARRLNHVTAAFVDDPLRFWRAAAFRARLEPEGFEFSPETLALMREMAGSGALESLSSERVWLETAKVLREGEVAAYVDVLVACGLLEGWAAANLMPSNAHLQAGTVPGETRLVALCAVNAALTGRNADALLTLLGVPARLRATCDIGVALATQASNGTSPDAGLLLETLERHDGLRRAERFEVALDALDAINAESLNAWSRMLRTALAAARGADLSGLRHAAPGDRAGEARRLRTEAIAARLI